MPRVSPFKALRYERRKVLLSKVVSPPYDVIDKKQRKRYAGNSPYNIVRVDLPERRRVRRDYAGARRHFLDWIEKGILKEDDSDSFYIYLQEYKIGRKKFSRYGIFSLLELEDRKRNPVLPHERVFAKPLVDRLRLMKKTRAHLSPVFIVFRDSDARIYKLIVEKVKDARPLVDIYFEGVRHKLWRSCEKPFMEKLERVLKSAKVFIADGHHRFEASMALKDYFASLDKTREADAGYNHTLVYLVSSKDKGLLILPTHRAVNILPEGFGMGYLADRLNGYFRVRPITAARTRDFLRRYAGRDRPAFVIYYKNRYLSLVLKGTDILKDIGPKSSSYQWKRLDVSILHNLIFAKLLRIREKVGSRCNIYYYKDAGELIDKVRRGEHSLAVFMNPPTMKDVESIAEAGERMPHKSTYFFPKPLTGIVIHKF